MVAIWLQVCPWPRAAATASASSAWLAAVARTAAPMRRRYVASLFSAAMAAPVRSGAPPWRAPCRPSADRGPPRPAPAGRSPRPSAVARRHRRRRRQRRGRRAALRRGEDDRRLAARQPSADAPGARAGGRRATALGRGDLPAGAGRGGPRSAEGRQGARQGGAPDLTGAAIAAENSDATYLRRIGAAVRATAASQAELADAVAAARGHGHTWSQIATMLGTSRPAAQERYDEPAKRPLTFRGSSPTTLS